MEDKLVRKTFSVCPVCLKKIEADIIEREGKIYLTKQCENHGVTEVMLDAHSWAFLEIQKVYFPLVGNRRLSQRDYYVEILLRDGYS